MVTDEEQKLIEAYGAWDAANDRMIECDKAIEALTRSADPIVKSAALQLWLSREEFGLGVTGDQARRIIEAKRKALTKTAKNSKEDSNAGK